MRCAHRAARFASGSVHRPLWVHKRVPSRLATRAESDKGERKGDSDAKLRVVEDDLDFDTAPPPWVLPSPRNMPLPPTRLGPVNEDSLAAAKQRGSASDSGGGHEPPPSPEEHRKRHKGKSVSDDFYANCGLAIRTLREELPRIFQEELSYDIYTDDVGLVDHFTGAHNHLYGKRSYKTLFKNIRIVAHVLFTGARLEILRIWQPDERRISMRWTVRATPRLLGGWAAPDVSLDGISEYHLDSDGKIYQHVVERREWDISRMIAERAAQLWPNLAAEPRTGVPSFYKDSTEAAKASYDDA